MMTDFDTAKILSHRRNIQRYCRLLATELTEIERQYLHRRIAEEYAELKRLQSEPVEQVIATQAMVRDATNQSSPQGTRRRAEAGGAARQRPCQQKVVHPGEVFVEVRMRAPLRRVILAMATATVRQLRLLRKIALGLDVEVMTEPCRSSIVRRPGLLDDGFRVPAGPCRP